MLTARKLISPVRYSIHSISACLNKRFESTKNENSVKIGCASGFWGDTATAVPQLLYGSKLDFLMLDYLSEITMSLLAAARQKIPEMGYTPDFVQFAVGPYLKDFKKKGVRIITNAGGINPHSCAKALKEAAKNADVDLKIYVVTGDDLMPKKKELIEQGIMDIKSKSPLSPNITTMNAYLGAGPIAKALDCGADIVLTGRCTDSALCLGPLLHTFKWQLNDWNKLASGSLAGHLIECGAQVTGGIFTDWHKVPQWEIGGFPIAECYEDGKIVISKPPGTGGLISRASVAEQLVYEIDDPENYILPDVICDFSNVKISETEDGVLVTGAKGKPGPKNYKVCATHADGYRCIVATSVVGPRAAEKAQRVTDAILKRCQMIFKKLQIEDFTKTYFRVLGTESAYGAHASAHAKESREVMTWMGVQHSNKMALGIFARELASAGTGMAPGLTSLVGGRPKPSPVLRLLSFMYPKENVEIKIHGPDGSVIDYKENANFQNADKMHTNNNSRNTPSDESKLLQGTKSYRLEDIAYARSGDKGNTCNIGIIARNPAFYPYLKKYLTVDVVKKYFEHFLEATSSVKRYELPGIQGLNFVLEDSLGGGGVASLRPDPQGKAYGQMLLDYQMTNMPELKDLIK